MKYLSPSKTTSTKVFQRGIADLAMEACFLSLLQHNNIINLHYVSGGMECDQSMQQLQQMFISYRTRNGFKVCHQPSTPSFLW